MDTAVTPRPSCSDRCHRMTAAGLCDWCARRLRRELDDLPGLYAQVAADLARTGGTGERITGSREAPLPVRLDALSWIGPTAPGTVRDTAGIQTGPIPLAGALAEWCRVVAEDRSLRPPLALVPDLAAFLLRHADWCAQQYEWADDYAAEIHAQWRTGRGLAGITPMVYRMPAPCPTCGHTTLARENGSDSIECETCGRIWREHEYRHLVLVLAAEMKRGA